MSCKPLPGNVLTWAEGLDAATVEQAQRTASLPFVEKPLALMADAHLGKGSTIGSVIATQGAIIPAAVGVDIGCGVIAQRTDLTSYDLPDNLGKVHEMISARIPSGIPRKKGDATGQQPEPQTLTPGLAEGFQGVIEDSKVRDKVTIGLARSQMGTLGSGNHFVELAIDSKDNVWIVVHSGSRGIGNLLARVHIDTAKGLMEDWFIGLPDPDLAYLIHGTEEFHSYITSLLWAQEYARENRVRMVAAARAGLSIALRRDAVRGLETVNCHHNYTEQEHHHGKNLWVTRKGAIRARRGDRGVIPGSMADGSWLVEGLGNSASYNSASHGAGRRMSRNAARRNLTAESLDLAMSRRGIMWNEDAEGLLDEHPEAYKNLNDVMDAQSELVEKVEFLSTILNYKGQ